MLLAARMLLVLALLTTAYYLMLAVLAWYGRVRGARDGSVSLAAAAACVHFVLVIPARNEAIVIGRTVERALGLDDADRLTVLVMDDGSDDETAAVARAVAPHDPRLLVVERPAHLAGRGKGEVLNEAYRRIRDMVCAQDERIGGAAADQVVVGILDADGWLEPHVLTHVRDCFTDPRVAGVQLPVRMWNAGSGFLARMQDIEFVIYGHLFQAGREPIGSVLMGGNGQFMRLAALEELGSSPWTSSLTEDLDIGLRLVERGWRHRFCARAYVAQQALGEPRRFVRQRTRWVQGHLGCWSHLPRLWDPRARVPLRARIDLSFHLLLGLFGVVGLVQVAVTLHLAFGTLSWAQIVPHDDVRAPLAGIVLALLTFVPLAVVGVTYQRFAHAALPGWALPGVLLLYGVYHYLWGAPACVRAIARLVARRRSWAKTSRSSISSHDLAAEAASQGAIS